MKVWYNEIPYANYLIFLNKKLSLRSSWMDLEYVVIFRFRNDKKRILTNCGFLAILQWFIQDTEPINRRYSTWSLLEKTYMS